MPKVHVRSTDDSFVIDPANSPNDNVQTDTGFFGELAHQVATIIGPGYQWFTGSLPATLVSLANHVATGSAAHGGFIAFIQQGGVSRAQRDTVNYTGGGVTVTDDSSGGGRTQVNIPASGPSSLDIQNNGSGDVVGYVKLNFVGPQVSVVDDGSNARANIVIDSAPGDGTVTSAKASSDAVIPLLCTSTTRPANAKPLFIIFETDTDNLLYNAGTFLSPSWVALSWQRASVNGGASVPVRSNLNVISESVSVSDNSITNSTDLTVNASPSKLTTTDFIGDYVAAGFLPSPGAITSVPTGVAYVGGIRVQATSPLSVTLQPSSDNYVDLRSDGTLTVTSLTVGSTEPTVATNSLRLFSGTTDSLSVVTTVVDKRVTRPVVRSHDHAIADLPISGVTAGTYDVPRISVNAKGMVTFAQAGSSIVLTPASSTVLGGSYLSVDMPSGQEATPYVVARHDPTFETRIEGLNVTWNSANSITVGTGAAWIPAQNRLYNVPSPITLSSLTLTAATWYYLYIYDNGGTPAAELVTTAPATAYKGDARVKGGPDNTRRFIFALRTHPTTANTIIAFMNTAPNKFFYTVDTTSGGGNGLSQTSSSTVSTGATIDASSKAPVGIAKAAYIGLYPSSGGMEIRSPTNATLYWIEAYSPQQWYMPLTSSATWNMRGYSGTQSFFYQGFEFSR